MSQATYRNSRLLDSRRLAAVIGFALVASFTTVYVRADSEKKAAATIELKIDTKAVNRGSLESASFSTIVKKVSPSVVKLNVQTKARMVEADADMFGLPDPMLRQFFGGRLPQMRQPSQSGLGSGVIISTDGYIVTNNHVIDKADIVTVVLDDGRELKAKVVGRDPQTDIAVIKVDAKNLPAITIASSSQVEVGDRVLAIGNPFGIGETVTSGIVSAMSRRAGIGLAYEDFIQTDAAINPGNSGGALVDVDGRLIGINTAILSRSGGFMGVGLAVPSDIVKHVTDSLVRSGKVVRGYLGVNIQNLNPMLSESFGLGERKGALVSEVVPGSPAAKAGLKDGDIILSADGKPVSDAPQFSLKVASEAPGTKLTLEVLRDGKTETLEVITGTRTKDVDRRNGLAVDETPEANNDAGVLNGVAVTDVDPNSRRQAGLPPRLNGALITNVEEGSASARAGIQAGDIILEINRQPVKDASDAVQLSEAAKGPKTLVKLWSRGGTVYTVVDESDKPSS